MADALVLASRHGIDADWQRLSACDICGIDPVGLVRRGTPGKRIDWEKELATFRSPPGST